MCRKNELNPTEPEFLEISIPESYKLSDKISRNINSSADIYVINVKATGIDGLEVIGK